MRPLPGRLVLLGHPVDHSLSPTFQNAALRRAALPLTYEELEREIKRVFDRIAAEQAPGAS